MTLPDLCKGTVYRLFLRDAECGNHNEVHPRASSNYIDIPDTTPGDRVKITVSMNAHGFEGKTECVWIMVDCDGNDCFRHSSIFTFVIDANFTFEKKRRR